MALADTQVRELTTVVSNGVRIALDPEVISKQMLSVLSNGKYEQGEAREIPRILEQNDRVVEIGGGIGFISSLVSREKKAASIAVYEANPMLIPSIQRTHQLNGVRAEVFNAVIQPSRDTATVPFYVRENFWASSLLPGAGFKQKVEVPVVSFDSILERHRPTMMIVDIEGGELEMFKGVSLTGIKKIYIELHQKVIGRIGMKQLFDFFSSRDFHYDQHHSHGSVVLFSHVLR